MIPSAQARRVWLVAVVAAAMLLAAFSGSAASRLVPQSTADATYVLDGHGALWAWGDNTAGNLGDGTQVSRARPRRVEAPGVTRWEAVSAGSRILAVDQAGRLWAWGLAGTTRYVTPVRLAADTNRWQRVAALAGEPFGLSLDARGEAWVWRVPNGRSLADAQPKAITRPERVGRWLDVVGGKGHALLLADSGRVFFLGKNVLGVGGPLAESTGSEQFVEVPAPDPRHRWLEIAAGPQLAFARLSDGEWYYWGAAVAIEDAQVSLTPNPNSTLLRRPEGVRAWRKVTAGETFLLLLSDDGRTFGLGDNSLGKLAYPEEHKWSVSFDNEPLRVFPVVPLAQQAADIAAGLRHGLALGEDGLIYTWGANGQGQLGRGVNGSDWKPHTVPGEDAPFSPTAAPLPQLQFVALQPSLIAPVLAGQPGQPARFEIRRVNPSGDGNAAPLLIPVLWELTSPHSLPGLPLNRVELLVAGNPPLPLGAQFLLPPGAPALPLEFRGIVPPELRLSQNDSAVAAEAGLRAVAPPWVEWVESDTVPFNLSFPVPWSAAPFGRVSGGTQWFAGIPHELTVSFGDADGWVAAWELYDACAGTDCGPAELLAGESHLRGFAGVTNQVTVPWVPKGSAPNRDLVLVLRDNAGSVVTNRIVVTVQDDSQPRFHVAWEDTPPALELPATITVRMEDRLGGSPVISRVLELRDASTGALILHGLPVETADRLSLVLEQAGDFTGRLILGTADSQRHQLELPLRQVAQPGGLPLVFVEASDPDAAEQTSERGAFRVTRVGGDVAQSLTVPLRLLAVSSNAVPAPRLSKNFTAATGEDFQHLPMSVTFGPGGRSLIVPVEPLGDDRPEGNEGIRLGLGTGADFVVVSNTASAVVVIRDDDREKSLPFAAVFRGRQRHPADLPLTISSQGGPGGGIDIVMLELIANGRVATVNSTTLQPPLPLGRLELRLRLTDELGRVAESEPVIVEIVPELRRLALMENPDGTDRWWLSAQPEFQDMRLETSSDLAAWHLVQPWRVTPPNRVSEVTLPSGAMRYLRLVPANEVGGE
jgi:alpha-tubulin suppressor-like RCC1 family protein